MCGVCVCRVLIYMYVCVHVHMCVCVCGVCSYVCAQYAMCAHLLCMCVLHEDLQVYTPLCMNALHVHMYVEGIFLHQAMGATVKPIRSLECINKELYKRALSQLTLALPM